SSTGGVEVKNKQGSGYADPYGNSGQYSSNSFKSNGSAEYHESTTTYLQPGQYDDADLQALDYSEMESLLTDWLSCGGKVTLISPSLIRSHMSDQQVKDLQAGKAEGLHDLAETTGADVLIQIQAHPTRREGQLVVLLVAEG